MNRINLINKVLKGFSIHAHANSGNQKPHLGGGLLGICTLSLLIFLASCSSIDEDERFTYVRPANVSRAVLLEDFTGQRCVNCPNANDVIHQLQEQYGDSNVIAVGIHSGPLGFKGNARSLGLATDLGDTYYSHFGAEYQPVGMVNRHGLVDYTAWTAAVTQALQDTATVEINLTADYDSTSRQATVVGNVLALDNNVSGHLQLWVIEDSITAMQSMPNGSVNRTYVHNHVLRAAVNGDWGSDITIPATQSQSFAYEYVLPESYVADHCSFVAFVYDDSGVLQAAKVKIVKPSQQED